MEENNQENVIHIRKEKKKDLWTTMVERLGGVINTMLPEEQQYDTYDLDTSSFVMFGGDSDLASRVAKVFFMSNIGRNLEDDYRLANTVPTDESFFKRFPTLQSIVDYLYQHAKSERPVLFEAPKTQTIDEAQCKIQDPDTSEFL